MSDVVRLDVGVEAQSKLKQVSADWWKNWLAGGSGRLTNTLRGNRQNTFVFWSSAYGFDV